MIQGCSLRRAALIRGLMTDAEWAVFAPFLSREGSRGGRPAQDHRKVLDAILWVARTGSPWRDVPEELGNWNSVFRQYRRWTEAGVWDVILAAFVESDASDNVMQMIDSTIVRAHQHAAGGRGDSLQRSRPLARWLHDQAPCPVERRRARDRLRCDAGAGTRRNRVSRPHGGGSTRSRDDDRR